MQSQLIFQQEKEIERLRVQNALLLPCEAPVFAQLFSEEREIFALDVGCNDGTKTVQRFSADAVARVIGLEYNEELARGAQERYGDGRFSFYRADVEASDFPMRLAQIMRKCGIDGFDVIYLSFLLMHLAAPQRFLQTIRPFLKPQGKLIIVESDDAASTLSPDEDGRLGEFLTILGKDKYAGNRRVGAALCPMLSSLKFENIRVWCDAIAAGAGESEKKKAIFTTFFSYLPEDVALLLQAEPENEEYREWSRWLEKNYAALASQIQKGKSEISMGMKILSCTRGQA